MNGLDYLGLIPTSLYLSYTHQFHIVCIEFSEPGVMLECRYYRYQISEMKEPRRNDKGQRDHMLQVWNLRLLL